MKVPLSWLGEYFLEPLEAFEVAERLTLSGIEVEQVQPIGLHDPRVVVAEVRAIESIAGGSARVLTLQADRLRSVVTTLAGLEVGQRVALALPGATLFAGAGPALQESESGVLYG